jgi:hypothetical protein
MLPTEADNSHRNLLHTAWDVISFAQCDGWSDHNSASTCGTWRMVCTKALLSQFYVWLSSHRLFVIPDLIIPHRHCLWLNNVFVCICIILLSQTNTQSVDT